MLLHIVTQCPQNTTLNKRKTKKIKPLFRGELEPLDSKPNRLKNPRSQQRGSQTESTQKSAATAVSTALELEMEDSVFAA